MKIKTLLRKTKKTVGDAQLLCAPSLSLLQEMRLSASLRDAVMIDYFAGDLEKAPPEVAEQLENFRRNKGEELYTVLWLALTHQHLAPEEAKKTWEDILVHKYYMSEKLGRNVGIKVAVIDYLDNHAGRRKDFRLLSRQDLDCLLLFVNEDGLTGLYNHRYFQEQLREEWRRCKRYNRTFSLLLIDLDKFKTFNDRFGHRQGDILLREVSDFFKEIGREADIVARYGGDEFAFILPESNQKEALAFAERLQTNFREKHFGNPTALPPFILTVSIGSATFPLDALMPEELAEKADQALYRAKHAGRDCIRHAKLQNHKK